MGLYQASSHRVCVMSSLTCILPYKLCAQYFVHKVAWFSPPIFLGTVSDTLQTVSTMKIFNIEHTALQRYLYSEPFLEQKLNPSSMIAVHTVTCTPFLLKNTERERT